MMTSDSTQASAPSTSNLTIVTTTMRVVIILVLIICFPFIFPRMDKYVLAPAGSQYPKLVWAQRSKSVNSAMLLKLLQVS